MLKLRKVAEEGRGAFQCPKKDYTKWYLFFSLRLGCMHFSLSVLRKMAKETREEKKGLKREWGIHELKLQGNTQSKLPLRGRD